MKQMKTLVNQAWDHRINLRLDQCRLALSELKNRLSVRVGSLDESSFLDQISKTKDPEMLCQVYLLTASLARSDRQMNYSFELIRIVEDYLNQNECALFFQVHFQKGLNFFGEGDYSSALDYFLSARLLTRENHEKLFALGNALFCLDNLGLSYEATYEELQTVIKKNQKKSKAIQAALSQIQWFEYRYLFRNGKIDKIFQSKSESVVNQSYYFKIWASDLPYHQDSDRFDPRQKEKFYLASPDFYLKAYRLRTLQGILHPDDLVEFKVKEFADRLYLWVWRWLCDPNRFPAQKILSLFKNIDFKSLPEKLSSEDYQMIRNALLWLGLFDPSSTYSLEKIVRSLKPNYSSDFDIFKFEYQLILYLTALRDKKDIEAQDYLSELKRMKLWQSDHLLLKEMVDYHKVKGDSLLFRLCQHLKDLFQEKVIEKTNALTVDFTEFRVSYKNNSVLSEAMCMAYDLFLKSPVVSCAEFASGCFGIRRYDSFLHQPKIFNLLARMRKLSPPEIDFSVKSEKIYFKGEVDSILFLKENVATRSLKDQEQWRQIVSHKSELPTQKSDQSQFKPSVILRKALEKKDLTRKDLEKLTGKSRSTVNRLIERWIEEGIIKKVGKAKNTKYVICKVSHFS